uniref:RRM domain-containing protein n=1 Tax=Ditylenchus dipsaci TaxID=166011 RepID=A0A915DU82_9BILA
MRKMGKNVNVGANVFVGNLDAEVDEKLLFDTFSALVSFSSISFLGAENLRDTDTGNSKGFAFINFASFEASDLALEEGYQGERHGTAAERLLAAQNPLFPNDRPHQVFSDIPGLRPMPMAPPTPPMMGIGGLGGMPPPQMQVMQQGMPGMQAMQQGCKMPGQGMVPPPMQISQQPRIQVAEILMSLDGQLFTPFFTKIFIFSNHFCRRDLITVDGVCYTCVEQFYMYYKARVFGDEVNANKIMLANKPAIMKKVGSKSSTLIRRSGVRSRVQVMVIAALRKFEQNPDLLQHLLDTRDSILVEASEKDHFWGIGLGMKSPYLRDTSRWNGLNVLGKILMLVRTRLLQRHRLLFIEKSLSCRTKVNGRRCIPAEHTFSNEKKVAICCMTLTELRQWERFFIQGEKV